MILSTLSPTSFLPPAGGKQERQMRKFEKCCSCLVAIQGES